MFLPDRSTRSLFRLVKIPENQMFAKLAFNIYSDMPQRVVFLVQRDKLDFISVTTRALPL